MKDDKTIGVFEITHGVDLVQPLSDTEKAASSLLLKGLLGKECKISYTYYELVDSKDIVRFIITEKEDIALSAAYRLGLKCRAVKFDKKYSFAEETK